MRKPLVIALVAIIAALLGASGVLYQRYQKTVADFRETKASEESVRARYAETFDAIAQIQDSLGAIALGDTAVNVVARELDAERRLSGPDSHEALDRIAALKASVQRSKDRITKLEADVKRSGIRVAGLQKLIAGLKQSVADKEQMVASLSVQVDSLHTEVQGLSTEVAQNQETIRADQQTIEEKRQEVATVYYVVADKKQLTTTGIVAAKGGVLGMGKTLTPSGRVDAALFTALDTDHQDVVNIPTPKAQVLSAQPPASYELRPAGGKLELHILDPVAFRKVKHLVIMTS